ncbi:MFS transporter, partial [Streptococcus pyogenes]
FVPIFFFFLLNHNVYGVFATMFLVMILAGAINPKMNALIMNRLPEEKLAMIGGGISTYFQMGSMLLRLLVSSLIVVLPVDWISLGFL